MKFLTVVLSMFIFGGCTVMGVGAASAIGGTHYLSGEIRHSYPVSIYHLYKVSLYTLKQENMKIISVKNSKTDADIEAEYWDETSVKIHIYYDKEGWATLGIRVGVIGDEKRSRDLHTKMKRYI